MAWIETHQSLPTHRKLLAFADSANIKPVQALGHVISLWLWALDNAPDGNLAGIPDVVIARAAQWTKRPSDFIELLTRSGFIDRTDSESVLIHDWFEYTGRLIQQRTEQRANNAARQERWRKSNALRNGYITPPVTRYVTPSNGPTVPDPTQPDPTQPDPTVPRGERRADAIAPPPQPVVQPDLEEIPDWIKTLRQIDGLQFDPKKDATLIAWASKKGFPAALLESKALAVKAGLIRDQQKNCWRYNGAARTDPRAVFQDWVGNAHRGGQNGRTPASSYPSEPSRVPAAPSAFDKYS